jgi:hypothetical protein
MVELVFWRVQDWSEVEEMAEILKLRMFQSYAN